MIFQNLAAIERLLEEKKLEEIAASIPEIPRRTSPSFFCRNPLMVSAVQLKHLNKLDSLDTDIAIVNLEDGVSLQQKPLARVMAAYFISQLNSKDAGPMISVRVNPLNDGGLDDIRLLNRVRPDAIRIPKVRSANDVDQALRNVHQEIQLHLSVETAEAFQNIRKLKIDERVTVYYLGLLDLLSDMKATHTLIESRSKSIDYMLTSFFVESKMAGVEPISFVYQNYTDLDFFRELCQRDQQIGFPGKGCISPGQAAIAKEVFSWDPEECRKAREVIKLFESHRERGITGFSHEGYGFIDEPIYRDALVTMENCPETLQDSV